MPAQVGYSGTPLVRKLGVKPGHEVAVLWLGVTGAPGGVEVPSGVSTPGRAAALGGVEVPGGPDSVIAALAELPGAAPPRRDLAGAGPCDVIVCFVIWRSELEERLAELRAHMAPAAGLWVAWPKRASGVSTDMSEHVVREIALPTGLVDNKVCAIDQVWSALRLVIRRELRAGVSPNPSEGSTLVP